MNIGYAPCVGKGGYGYVAVRCEIERISVCLRIDAIKNSDLHARGSITEPDGAIGQATCVAVIKLDKLKSPVLIRLIV